MFIDPTGKFFILGTILLTTTIGAIIGGSLSLAVQLIENDFDWSNINLNSILSDTLTGAAMGAAFGIGASAGMIFLGKASIASLSVTQSFGILVSTAASINFTAGIGSYLIENHQSENFSITRMMLNALGQTGKGLISFGVGAFFAATGSWVVGDLSNVVNRVFIRQIISYTPNYYFENTFMNL